MGSKPLAERWDKVPLLAAIECARTRTQTRTLLLQMASHPRRGEWDQRHTEQAAWSGAEVVGVVVVAVCGLAVGAHCCWQGKLWRPRSTAVVKDTLGKFELFRVGAGEACHWPRTAPGCSLTCPDRERPKHETRKRHTVALIKSYFPCLVESNNNWRTMQFTESHGQTKCAQCVCRGGDAGFPALGGQALPHVACTRRWSDTWHTWAC